MPNVTATPRSNSNGEVVTEFLDTVNTIPTTYTFLNTQERLKIKNNGYGSLQLTINGSAVTVLPSESKEFYGSIDSFIITSSGGVQSFEVVGTNYKDEEFQLTGSNVKLLDVVSVTGVGTLKPAVGSFKTYVFEVWGTASSFTLHIEAVGPSTTARTINKVWDELNNAYLAGSDITVAGFYSVSVPAFTTIQSNVTAIAGGNVNVAGGLVQ